MAKRFGKKFDNVDDAAAAADLALQRKAGSEQNEFFAFLVKEPDGKITRTDWATSGLSNAVRAEDINKLIQKYKGDSLRIAGFIHNHPFTDSGHEMLNSLLSEQDVQSTNETFKTPAFLTAMSRKGNTVGKFDVGGKTKTMNVREGGRSRPKKLGVAEPFLAQFPIREFERVLAQDILNRQRADAVTFGMKRFEDTDIPRQNPDVITPQSAEEQELLSMVPTRGLRDILR